MYIGAMRKYLYLLIWFSGFFFKCYTKANWYEEGGSLQTTEGIHRVPYNAGFRSFPHQMVLPIRFFGQQFKETALTQYELEEQIFWGDDVT